MKKPRGLIAIAFILQLSAGLPLAQSETPKADNPAAVATRYVRQLQNQMRDPDSFVLERVFSHVIEPLTKQAAKRIGKKEAAKWADRVGTIEFCFEYRSRNGYGGMNRGVAVAPIDGTVVPYSDALLDIVGGTCAGVWPGDKREITAEVK